MQTQKPMNTVIGVASFLLSFCMHANNMYDRIYCTPGTPVCIQSTDYTQCWAANLR